MSCFHNYVMGSPAFNLTLRNGVMKNFVADLSLGNLMLVFEGRKFYSQFFSKTIRQNIAIVIENKLLA